MPVLRPILFMPPRSVGESAARGGGMPAGGWGFCTIRRIATACRRRVAALMLQFPPRGAPSDGFSRLSGPRKRYGGPRGCVGPWRGCGVHSAGRLDEKWLARA